MNQPPPRDPVICPLHSDVTDEPMTFIQSWDGRDWYECPVPRCSCAIDYPAAAAADDSPRDPAPQHPLQDPHHSDDPAEWTDPEI
jgi:hypothetical protein